MRYGLVLRGPQDERVGGAERVANPGLVVEAEARVGHAHPRSTQIPRSSRTDSELIRVASRTREDRGIWTGIRSGGRGRTCSPPAPRFFDPHGRTQNDKVGGGMRYGLVLRGPQDERVGGAERVANPGLVVEAEARVGHAHPRSTQIPRSSRTDSE